MVNVLCKKCGKVYRIAEKVLVNLTCPVCGGVDIEFDHKVKRICAACGRTETVLKGEECKAFHQKTSTSPRRYQWKVEKAIDPTEAAKKAYTKVKRLTRKRKAESS